MTNTLEKLWSMVPTNPRVTSVIISQELATHAYEVALEAAHDTFEAIVGEDDDVEDTAKHEDDILFAQLALMNRARKLRKN